MDEAATLEGEISAETARISTKVRAAVEPLFRMGGYHSVIANTIHAAIMVLLHRDGVEPETPRDETGDSIDPKSGALLNKPVAPEHDDVTKKLEADRIARLPGGKFGIAPKDGELEPAPVQPEGAMVMAAAHPTGFGPAPVDPTQPPKSDNDPKGPFALARADDPSATRAVGGDAGKVQPTEFDAAAMGGDMRSPEQKAADDAHAKVDAGEDPLASQGAETREQPDAEAQARAAVVVDERGQTAKEASSAADAAARGPLDHSALDEPLI